MADMIIAKMIAEKMELRMERYNEPIMGDTIIENMIPEKMSSEWSDIMRPERPI